MFQLFTNATDPVVKSPGLYPVGAIASRSLREITTYR